MAAYYFKDPDAVLDYAVEWSSWLQDGETISTSTWDVPAGLTEGDGSNGAAASSATDTKATVWLMGGTANTQYTVTNRVVTSAGRTDDRSFTVKCSER